MDVYQASRRRFDEVFGNVMALYMTLKDNPQRTLRRAELKQGEVIAEAIDFLVDVELKAKRILPPIIYEVFMRLAEQGHPEILPDNFKQNLGFLFWKSKMDIAGHYRTLYLRAKNQRLYEEISKEKPSFPEDAMNPEDIPNE